MALFFFYRIFVGWCDKSFHITLCYAFREMVSHKCVEEFSLQFPANARAPRSARVINNILLPFASFALFFDLQGV